MPTPVRLPCPFCGGTRTTIERVERGQGYANFPDDPDRWAYSVICTSCSTVGPWSKASPESAIARWNQRPLVNSPHG